MIPTAPRPLLVSTRNAHKIREIREILGPRFEVCDLSILSGLAEVEETGSTFEENATLKALAVSSDFDGWVIADDSGLEVDALGGAPGVWSARFAGEGATDASNRNLLLEKLQGVRSEERSARFRCAIVLAKGGRKLAAFCGLVQGRILDGEKGAGGFGYDPLFVPEGFQQSFAEIGEDVKNSLSHRARALEALLVWKGWVE
ncbi:MAG: RdgB/HAM1 family non-canonical purine NTP pyrophosphatase [bacterium]